MRFSCLFLAFFLCCVLLPCLIVVTSSHHRQSFGTHKRDFPCASEEWMGDDSTTCCMRVLSPWTSWRLHLVIFNSLGYFYSSFVTQLLITRGKRENKSAVVALMRHKENKSSVKLEFLRFHPVNYIIFQALTLARLVMWSWWNFLDIL